MVKKKITFKDFNDREVTEEFHFHLKTSDLLEMEASHTGGYAAYMQRAISSEDNGLIYNVFKDLILGSVGRISEDGKRFIRNDEIIADFTESNAYSALLMEMMKDTDWAIEFFNGVMPSGLKEDLEQIEIAPPPPQREHQVGEVSPPKNEKILSKKDAEGMSNDELVRRMKDGWVIQT